MGQLYRTGCAAFAVAALFTSTLAFASAPGSSTARPLVTQKIDNSKLATLAHNVKPELNAQTDLGPVEDTMPVKRMFIVLNRPAETQAALATLIERQHQQGAPEFHQWLTPDQFGAKFGPSQQDIALVKEWLEQQGFTVNYVSHGNSLIDFSGTAQNVRESFHTQLHYVQVAGSPEKHFANDRNPQIPAALLPIIGGITGLETIPLHPNHTAIRSAGRNEGTHAWHVEPLAGEAPRPNYSDGSGVNYFIGPQDYYTIYNVNPLFAASHTGATASIAVVEQSDINYGTVNGSTNLATGGDVATFRNVFGVPGTLNMYVYHGYGTTTCTDPGVVSDAGEATLDAEWASALAPSAKLIFMSCSVSADGGIFGSLAALIDGNLSDAMSMSYGNSETGFPISEYNTLDTLYSQAAAQGQSVFVSTGDSGSDVADQNTNGTAISGINVSALSASPLVTASGGTDFQDGYDFGLGGAPQTTYFSATNSSTYGDALSYVPETTWNDSCASSLLANYIDATDPASFCSSTTAANDGLVAGDVVGGSGGFSKHYSAPSYQSGISGFSGTQRAQPDVAMFAANGIWGHALLFCYSGSTTTNCSSSNAFALAGGTSFVAPQMVGIAGLLRDYTGTRQGVLNYGLYALAKQQFTGTNRTACYANGQTTNTGLTTGLPASSCIFHDITTGNNDEPCAKGTLDCYVSGTTYGVLSLSTSSQENAYNAGVGYDESTGIGSLNVFNLVTNWNSAFTSSTSLSASPSTITSSQSTTLTASVTTGTPAGFTGKAPTLSGTVTFYSGTVSLGTCTISGSSCTLAVTGSQLGSGAHSITATLTSKAYPTSTSKATTVTVGASTATTTTTVTATPNSAAYQASVALKATVTASSGTATGTVSFVTGTTQLGSCTLSGGNCTLSTTALPVGTDTVTASYNGTTGFSASNGAVNVTVGKDTSTTAVTATPSAVAVGANVALKATVTASSSPTGMVSFAHGSTSLGSCTLSSGTCTLNTTALPQGNDSVTATYAGTTDIAGSSATVIVTVSARTTTTVLTVTPTSLGVGATASLKATVSAANGTAFGTITFKVGITVIGQCTLSNGTCTVNLNTNGQATGEYPVTAGYGGAAGFDGSTSSTVNVTLNKSATTTTVAVTPNPVTAGANATLTATVSRPGGTQGKPGGSVTFYSGTVLIGTADLNGSGVATYTQSTSGLGPNTYPITANYNGDSSDDTSSGSTSGTIN